jgi:hypothetical protein
MRVVIRFSLNRDPRSALRNALKAVLEAQGIMWTGRSTATYEGNIPGASIRIALSRFWRVVNSHSVRKARLDHFWMYSDRQPAPKAESDDWLSN